MTKIKELSSQEEKFAVFYCAYHNQTKAAYYSGLCENIKSKKTYDKLTPKEIRMLSSAGNRRLNKSHVLERIDELTNDIREKIKNNYINSQEAIFEFYDTIIQRSLIETEKISVKEGIAAAKELMKKFENDKKILKIEIVDPMKGRQN
jgi:hypothetical protein